MSWRNTPAHTHTPAPTHSGSAPTLPAPRFTFKAERVLLPRHVSVPRIGLGRPELAGNPQTRGVGAGGAAGAGCLCSGRTQRLCLPVCGVGGSPSLAPRRLVLFKRLLFSPCVFGKKQGGELGRGVRSTLASSAWSFCCCGHLPGCPPGPPTSFFPRGCSSDP